MYIFKIETPAAAQFLNDYLLLAATTQRFHSEVIEIPKEILFNPKPRIAVLDGSYYQGRQ